MTYLIILFGAILGTALIISARCAKIHISSKYQLSFKQTFAFYTNRNPWALIVGLIIIMAFMYFYPGILASYNSISDDNHIKYQEYIESVIDNLRIWSFGIGVASQGLGFLIVGFSDKKLKAYDDEINNSVG